MTVTVGTNVYLSVADADSYWSARNNSNWAAASTPEKEKALLEATQYIDGAYTFLGTLTSLTQLLAFPRAGLRITEGNFRGAYYDSTVIPPQIQSACAELALEALAANLKPSEARGGAIKKEKIDVIEIEYMDFAPSGKTYTFVSMLLKDLTIGSSNNIKLVRC